MLSQPNCWSEECKTPLRDRDHSGNDPFSVPSFLDHCSGMFMDLFRGVSGHAGSRETGLAPTEYAKHVILFY